MKEATARIKINKIFDSTQQATVELITRFEKKIHDTLNRVWGEKS